MLSPIRTFMHSKKYDSIVVDLDTILAPPNTHDASTKADQQMLEQIFLSHVWFDFEQGKIEEQECYMQIAAQSPFTPDAILNVVNARRESLRIRLDVLFILKQLKEKHDLRLLVVGNIPAPQWAVVQASHPDIWAEFDAVFLSSASGSRKPSLTFFRRFFEFTGIDPQRSVYIDDKLDSIVTVSSFGMTSILSPPSELARSLAKLLRDSLSDAEQWLRDNARVMWSITNTGQMVKENFAQLLLLEVTGDHTLANPARSPRLANFFIGTPLGTTSNFPNDCDTTSIACTVLDHFTTEVKHEIMDEMLLTKNEEGIAQPYFDHTRPRVDAVVCVNILAFFSVNGRAHDLPETMSWVIDVLKNRAYKHGTYYYATPETFLYFFSRLLHLSPPDALPPNTRALLVECIREQFGDPGDALALSMRIVVAHELGIITEASSDCYRLLDMQNLDGSWPVGWFYKYGRTRVLLGNQGLTTALAVDAVRRCAGLGKYSTHITDLPM